VTVGVAAWAGASLAFLAVTPAAIPEGEWINQAGSVIVRIAPCETGLCGTVSWASDKAQKDAARGGTISLVGTEVMHGFVPVADDHWRGRLFLPDVRRRVKATLRWDASDRIAIRGCELGGVICRTQYWWRAPR
jgi:uncharacterized protein (DUF2147 family)